jgi:hypothetical protein
MSEVTTESLVVECRQVAEDKAQAMGNAGVADRAAAYVGLKFEVGGSGYFECQDPSGGGSLDLLDMVLDVVEQRNPVEFTPHRDGGGKQTVYWRAA